MGDYRKFDVELLARVHAELDDPGATDGTVRYLVEEDLRDKGWNAEVRLSEDGSSEQERKFCGYSWEDMDRVLTVICDVEDRVDMTDQEMNDYDIAVQCVAQVMNRMRDGKPIDWD